MSRAYLYAYQTAEGIRPHTMYYETNLRRARKTARKMAQGNRQAGSWCAWHVLDMSGKVVANGIVS